MRKVTTARRRQLTVVSEGMVAHMKQRPAATRVERATMVAMIPTGPLRLAAMQAMKWMRMVVQPTSQRRWAALRFFRSREAKALARAATASMSAIFDQSIALNVLAPESYCYFMSIG